jgi:2-hydroxychromene-2-carboxylate isomerase
VTFDDSGKGTPTSPPKKAYMWRDIERRAQMYGMPIRVSAPYPVKDSLRANRVAIVGLDEG